MAKKSDTKKKERKKNELPSGAFRVQVFDYMDENKKKHYKSFTASSKKEAEYLALQWLNNKKEEIANINIHEAVTRYIDSKRGVLSPGTVRGYEGIQRNYLSGKMGLIRLKDIDSTTVQIWISELSGRLSPKTVRNAHALLTSALEMFAPDLRLKNTLPAKKKPELYTPSDDDVAKLLECIKDKELEIAILLAAFGPMRRGEICALTSSDIKGNIVDVNKSIVLGSDGLWHVKQPKTYSSYRQIEYPEFVIDKMKGIEGQIISVTPSRISGRFRRAVIKAELPFFRFHDLRHYSASIMHAIGVPDQYIMERGGWQTDNVMKTVYRDTIDLESARQNKKILKHFEKVSHEVSHEA